MAERVARDILAEEIRKAGPLPDGGLEPSEPSGNPLTVPAAKANRILREVVRLVADLPRGSTPDVVWTHGRDELLVHTDRTSMTCAEGLIGVRILTDCDQVDGPVGLTVPLAVGTARAPSGLLVSTFSELTGPQAITAVWSSSLTAFAWESVIEVARAAAAATGTDASGRPLVPGAIAAAPGAMVVHPMARHPIGARG